MNIHVVVKLCTSATVLYFYSILFKMFNFNRNNCTRKSWLSENTGFINNIFYSPSSAMHLGSLQIHTLAMK